MIFRQLFDPQTSTYSYLLADEHSRDAVLIDPVLEQLERDVALIRQLDLRLLATLETHVHADHVTAGGALRERLGSRTGVAEVAGVSCADLRLADGDRVAFGRHHLEVRSTPGHTAGCVSFVTDDQAMVFTGDALLVRGCGRTDFQGGDAATLYRSVHERLLSLPDATLVYPGHDYKGHTVSTVGEEKRFNPRLGGGRTEEEFVVIMDHLDLAQPERIAVAVPANARCGSWAPVRTDAGVPEVDWAWLTTPESEACRLLDVRGHDEVRRDGKLARAEVVPLERVADVVAGWDPKEPLLVMCRSGGRSAVATRALRTMGFANVASVAGGLQAWAAAGNPVVRT